MVRNILNKVKNIFNIYSFNIFQLLLKKNSLNNFCADYFRTKIRFFFLFFCYNKIRDKTRCEFPRHEKRKARGYAKASKWTSWNFCTGDQRRLLFFRVVKTSYKRGLKTNAHRNRIPFNQSAAFPFYTTTRRYNG